VSSAAARYFAQFAGNDLPLKIIYNGVRRERCLPSGDYAAVRARMREQWNIPQDAVVVGYVGRQTKEKNFMAAARAVGQLDQNHYAVYYGTDGTGKKPDEGLKLWCLNNIPGRHRLYLPTNAVGDVFAGLDVLVLASHREACSLVLIEAWMAGVPVVAT
jgi:glycosyltransferase involved in cell wall biosynthesis